MQLTVKATTKASKQARGRTYWGIKHTDDQWYNLFVDAKPNMGQNFEVEVKTSEYQGKTYRWAEVKKTEQPKQPAAGNGHAPATASWWDYKDMMQLAHEAARDFEPDDAQARAALVNTAMIAFSNGKISLPKEEDEVPPPGDDDNVPF